MIEIGGFIHEFDVCETQEKRDDGHFVVIPQRYEYRWGATDDKNQIGPFAERLNPLEAVIAEKERWFDIKFLNPSIGCKTYHAYKHQQTE